MRITNLDKEIKKEITCEIVLELSREDGIRTYSVLRIVSWNAGQAKLEKRAFYIDKEGTEKIGKVLSMNINDLNVLFDMKEEIIKAITTFQSKYK